MRRSATSRRTKRSVTPSRSARPATSQSAGAFIESLCAGEVMFNLWPEPLHHWDTGTEDRIFWHAEAPTPREKLISQRIA